MKKRSAVELTSAKQQVAYVSVVFELFFGCIRKIMKKIDGFILTSKTSSAYSKNHFKLCGRKYQQKFGRELEYIDRLYKRELNISLCFAIETHCCSSVKIHVVNSFASRVLVMVFEQRPEMLTAKQIF